MPQNPNTTLRGPWRHSEPVGATGETVAEYARRVSYPVGPPSGHPGRAIHPDTLRLADSRYARAPFPETDTVALPSCPVTWRARRAEILRNRDHVRSVHRERMYADGFVDGSDALRADRLARADLRRFAVRSV